MKKNEPFPSKRPGALYLAEATYLPVTLEDKRVLRFITEMQKAWSNGGAWIRCLEATTLLDDEFPGIQRNVIEFFKSPSLRACIPELKIPDNPSLPETTTVMGRHQFEGTLTDILLDGGAYGKFQGSYEEARHITKECIDALCNLLWDSPIQVGAVCSISGGWTPAFYGVAWDETSVLRSKDGRKWIVMWMTDTD